MLFMKDRTNAMVYQVPATRTLVLNVRATWLRMILWLIFKKHVRRKKTFVSGDPTDSNVGDMGFFFQFSICGGRPNYV